MPILDHTSILCLMSILGHMSILGPMYVLGLISILGPSLIFGFYISFGFYVRILGHLTVFGPFGPSVLCHFWAICQLPIKIGRRMDGPTTYRNYKGFYPRGYETLKRDRLHFFYWDLNDCLVPSMKTCQRKIKKR